MTDMKPVTIYALVDPDRREIFYVGKTRRGLRYRLSGHIRERRKVNAAKERAIDFILSTGNQPEIEEIEKCTDEEWESREIFWISELRKLGFPLTNRNNGGSGTHIFSARTRAAISMALSTSEKKKAADAKRVGVRFTSDRIDAIKEGVRSSLKFQAKVGSKLPEEWREAISSGRKRSALAQAQIDILHAAKIGVPRSEETKAKIRATQKLSEKCRRAQREDSLRKMGTPQSPEQKAGLLAYFSRKKGFKAQGVPEMEARRLARGAP